MERDHIAINAFSGQGQLRWERFSGGITGLGGLSAASPREIGEG